MKSIEVKQYFNIVKECFNTDKDLIDKWHINSGNGLDQCVAKTLFDLITQTKDFKFYKIINKNNKIIGFYGNEGKEYLTSFFIKPEYRNKTIIKDIWNIMIKDLDDNFKCGVYEKNIPANKFLEKNNGKVIKKDKYNNNNYIVYQFKRN